MRKKTRLWSFALAGALAVSNLSVVAAPFTGIVAMAKVEQKEPEVESGYVKTIEAKTNFANQASPASLVFTVTADYGVDKDGKSMYAATPDSTNEMGNPTVLELKKGTDTLGYAKLATSDGGKTINGVDLTIVDGDSKADNYVEDYDGEYSIVLYYGTFSGNTSGLGAIPNDKRVGIHELTTKTFSIYKVIEKASSGTQKAYYELQGDDHAIVAVDAPTEIYSVNGSGNGYYKDEKISVTANTTLIGAKADSATIKYDLGFDGGDGDTDNDVVSVTTAINATTKLPDLSHLNGIEGYVFTGWSTSADGAATLKAGDSITINKKNVEYFATWTHGYVVQLMNNDGSKEAADPIAQKIGESITLPSEYKDKNATDTKIFAGWETDPNKTAVSSTGYEPGASLPYDTKKEAEAAKVKFSGYTLKSDGDEVKIFDADDVDSAFTATGLKAALIAKNVKLYSVLSNGTAIVFVNPDTAPYITSDVYKGKSWIAYSVAEFDAQEGLAAAVGTDIDPIGTTKSYWGKDIKTPTNEEQKTLVQYVQQDKSAKLNANVYKSNTYKFLGWAKNEDDAKKGIVSFTDGQSVTVGSSASADIKGVAGSASILYAVWEPRQEYHVLYFSNRPGEGSQYDSAKVSNNFYEGITGDFRTNPGWSLSGYTLKGWSEDAAATEATYTLGQKDVTVTKDMELYAVWQANGGKEDSSTGEDSSATKERTEAIAAANTAAEAATKDPSDANIKALQDAIDKAVAAKASATEVKALTDKLATALTTAKKNAETSAADQKKAADAAKADAATQKANADAATKKAADAQAQLDKQFKTLKKAKATNGYVVNTFANGEATLVSIPAAKTKATFTIASKVTVNGKKYKVTKIAAKALKANTKIKTLTVPASVKQIGANAFGSKVTKLTVKGSNVQVLNNALKSINKKAKVVAKNAYTLTQLKTNGKAKKTVTFSKK